MNGVGYRIPIFLLEHLNYSKIIPVYNADNPKTYQFSGNRVHRGLYKTASGRTFNADVNGALNIMRKSSVVNLSILYGRGEVDTPIRIRIA